MINKEKVKKIYRHHFFRYLVVGVTSFIIDFGLLFFFRFGLGIDLAIATSIGYWVSITYNFILNRSWSFSAGDRKKLRKHALAYGVLIGFNYTFTVLFVARVSHALRSSGVRATIAVAMAKVLAVVIQTTWNYFIYKNYIFAKKEHRNTSEDTSATTS